MPDPLKPAVSLLVKLGSIAIHAEEALSPDGHPFDRDVIIALIAQEDVKAWLKQMDKLALLPKKRRP